MDHIIWLLYFIMWHAMSAQHCSYRRYASRRSSDHMHRVVNWLFLSCQKNLSHDGTHLAHISTHRWLRVQFQPSQFHSLQHHDEIGILVTNGISDFLFCSSIFEIANKNTSSKLRKMFKTNYTKNKGKYSWILSSIIEIIFKVQSLDIENRKFFQNLRPCLCMSW